MSFLFKVRVHYPPGPYKIMLRLETDWHKDVAPSAQGEKWWEFHVLLNQPFCQFKVIRVSGLKVDWSVGNNYVGRAQKQVREIYPFFNEPRHRFARISSPQHQETVNGPFRYRVYRPPGYDENPLKRYPVLYMHDGRNLFFPEESFLGQEWEVDERMDLLDLMNVIDRVMVVGIHAKDRMQDYTHPGYEAYGKAIVDQLKPHIDRHFRTLPGRLHTFVMGSSLGAVVSLFLAWNWPQVFGGVACLSGSFGYKDDLFDRIAQDDRRNIRIYLDSGWPHDNFEVVRRMHQLLLWRGYKNFRDLMYLAFPNALHNEHFWAIRSHVPYQFLFGKA